MMHHKDLFNETGSIRAYFLWQAIDIPVSKIPLTFTFWHFHRCEITSRYDWTNINTSAYKFYLVNKVLPWSNYYWVYVKCSSRPLKKYSNLIQYLFDNPDLYGSLETVVWKPFYVSSCPWNLRIHWKQLSLIFSACQYSSQYIHIRIHFVYWKRNINVKEPYN